MYTPGRPERGGGLNTFENSQKTDRHRSQTDRISEIAKQRNEQRDREMNRDTQK